MFGAKMNKKEQKKKYCEWKKQLSKEFELCEECKSKVPEGQYVSSDNGSGCELLFEDEPPLGFIDGSVNKPIGWGWHRNIFICNDCYIKNIDRRELIRQIYIAYTCNIDFYYFKIAVEGMQNWVECTKRNMANK